MKSNKIKSISFNLDYSPFSKKRDETIIKWCKKKKIYVHTYEDILLIDINMGKTTKPKTKQPYVMYKPFIKNLRNHPVRALRMDRIIGHSVTLTNKYSIKKTDLKQYYKKNDNPIISGRKQALTILKSLKSISS